MTIDTKPARKTPARKAVAKQVAVTGALDLNQLNEIGGLITGEAASRTVEWTKIHDDGTKTTHKFIVGVVKLGVAAAERIWTVSGDESRCATIIHETIRLGENFDERISYEDASRLDPSLFAALSGVADSVNPKPKGVKEGKA